MWQHCQLAGAGGAAVRSGAMSISYELSLGITVLTMVVLSGTMSISGIVESQA